MTSTLVWEKGYFSVKKHYLKFHPSITPVRVEKVFKIKDKNHYFLAVVFIMKQTCRAAYARNVERNTTVKRKPVGHFQRKLSFRQLKANLERTWSGISYWSISLFHKWRASCSIVFILIRPAARILEQMFFSNFVHCSEARKFFRRKTK